MISFSFPDSFLWGTATSSFQVEGAAFSDGKGPSIWDTACANRKERFSKGATPAVSADFYHRYREDIRAMRELGLKSFRLSIAWPRLFPEGIGQLNPKGADFYHSVIDTLLENGIEPFVDLYHWDLPQALQDKGGFENRALVGVFADYAERCFRLYGDRVKLWSTFNEPSVVAISSYAHMAFPPFKKNMEAGMRASQNLLLMHYAAIERYRSLNLGGKIGAVIAFVPVYPGVPGTEDDGAAIRQQDMVCNWWLRPMFYGEYPQSVLCTDEILSAMPPGFAPELRTAFRPMDFVGINYYCPASTVYCPQSPLQSRQVKVFYGQTDYGFTVYPQGLYDSLHYVRENYGSPEMYVTENGIGNFRAATLEKDLDDGNRIEFMREHFRELNRAIRSGCDVRGYYYWAHFDDFTGEQGYDINFGLVHVDRQTLRRTPRKSWYYYQRCIAANRAD